MGASKYMQEIRKKIGCDLLMLPGVAGLVRDEQGRVLIARRSDDGTWNIPTGAIDPGETPSQSIIREVREETGLDVVPHRVVAVFGGGDYRHTYPNGDVVEGTTIVMECRIAGGALAARDGESASLRFVDASTATELVHNVPAGVFHWREEAAFFE